MKIEVAGSLSLVAALLEQAQEHQVDPERAGAPPGDVLVRHDAIAAGLRHVGPVPSQSAHAPGTSDRARRRALAEVVQPRVLVPADVGKS